MRSTHNQNNQQLLQQQQLSKKKRKKGVSLRLLLGEQTVSSEMLTDSNGSPTSMNAPDEGINDEDEEDDEEEEGDSSGNHHLPGLQNRLSQRSHHAHMTMPHHSFSLQQPPSSSSSLSSSFGSPLSSHPSDTTTTFVREISPGVYYSP